MLSTRLTRQRAGPRRRRRSMRTAHRSDDGSRRRGAAGQAAAARRGPPRRTAPGRRGSAGAGRRRLARRRCARALADDVERQPGGVGRVARGDEAQLALAQLAEVRHRRAGGVLVDGTQDRRDNEQRRGRVALADGVEEPVHRRPERPQPHHVTVDQVDAELEADQVRRSVADRSRGERIEHRAPGESEVDQLDSPARGSDRRPRRARALGVGAVADRAAVVQPDLASACQAAPRRARSFAARPAR